MEKSGEYSSDVLIAEVGDEIQNFGYNEKSDKNESTRSNMEDIKQTRDEVIAAYDKHQGLNREKKLVNRDSIVGYARLGDTFGGVAVREKHKQVVWMIYQALHDHYLGSFDGFTQERTKDGSCNNFSFIKLGEFSNLHICISNNHGAKRKVWDPGIKTVQDNTLRTRCFCGAEY